MTKEIYKLGQEKTISLNRADVVQNLNQLRTYSKYKKKSVSLLEDVLYAGTQVLLEEQGEYGDDQKRNESEVDVSTFESLLYLLNTHLSELTTNLAMCKSMLSSIFSYIEHNLQGIPLKGEDFSYGLYSSTPEYLGEEKAKPKRVEDLF